MGNTLDHGRRNCEPGSLVKTIYGEVQGKKMYSEGERTVDAFLKVPFAKPPVGPLRFKKPERPDPWSGVLQTTEWAPRGIQSDPLIFTKWKYGETSEDNLYLNVFCPTWECPEEGFPVMVFVHGGGFVSDSTMKYGDIGISKHLVFAHNVVVITIQYRLGYLGFFTTGDGACDDNVGLWDMRMALEWVQENIRKFNGNPANVTLFGQSAGGAAVDLLSLSPHSRDLFHKVCPMAGSAGNEWAINTNAVEICRRKAAELGVTATNSTGLVEQLRSVPAMKFATYLKLDIAHDVTNLQSEIGPRIDGDFFPKSLYELRREAPPKPRLIGTCEFEGLIFQALQGPILELFFDAKQNTLEKMHQMIADRIPETLENFVKLRKEAWTLYFGNSEEKPSKDTVNRTFAKFYSDIFLNIGTLKCVSDILNSGTTPADTYFYSFEYFNPKMFGLIGHKFSFKAATHCTELSYLFNVGIIWNFTFNDDDKKMLEMMTKLWCNFARYGDPNGRDDVEESKLSFNWAKLTRLNHGKHLKICLEPTMVEAYQDHRPRFWINVDESLKSL